jgi:hypothetical protein
MEERNSSTLISKGKAMNVPRNPTGNRAWVATATALAVISLQMISAQPLSGQSPQNADDGRGILRFDPVGNRLIPVRAEELKAGYIYSHFNQRLNRRVWSYVQTGGKFWHAFGERTTQEAWRLDIRASMGEQMDKLAELAPGLYEKLRYAGEGRVFVRLTSEGRWVIAEDAMFPTIYDAETGRRWERHTGKYIPVSSGPWRYQWVVHDGRYVPAGRLPRAAPAAASIGPATRDACNCR